MRDLVGIRSYIPLVVFFSVKFFKKPRFIWSELFEPAESDMSYALGELRPSALLPMRESTGDIIAISKNRVPHTDCLRICKRFGILIGIERWICAVKFRSWACAAVYLTT